MTAGILLIYTVFADQLLSNRRVITIIGDYLMITLSMVATFLISIGTVTCFSRVITLITSITPTRRKGSVPPRAHILGSREARHEIPLLPPTRFCVGDEGQPLICLSEELRARGKECLLLGDECLRDPRFLGNRPLREPVAIGTLLLEAVHGVENPAMSLAEIDDRASAGCPEDLIRRPVILWGCDNCALAGRKLC